MSLPYREGWWGGLNRLDLAVYVAVAATYSSRPSHWTPPLGAPTRFARARSCPPSSPAPPSPASTTCRPRRRHLYDGGIVANVPMRIAVDMGARSLVVLDCSYPGQLPSPGDTLCSDRPVHDHGYHAQPSRPRSTPRRPRHPRRLPSGTHPRLVSPLDFSHSHQLIEASYEAVRPFLASLTINGPGLYGSPAA